MTALLNSAGSPARAHVNSGATDSSASVLAFDIGGTTVKASAFDADLTELASAVRPALRGPAVVTSVAAAATEVLDQLDPGVRATIGAAGVVVPGLVDAAAGVARYSVNLDLVDLPLGAILADRLALPVRIGHDVTSAGLAVHQLENCIPDPCVVVIGTGVAAVSFVDGALVRGTSSQAGEIGHWTIRPGGALCACGRRGCLEAIASGASIARAYAERTRRPVEGARTVAERISHDPAAAEVWADAVSALADTLAGIQAVTAPGEFVLAGGLSEAGPLLADPLNAELAARRGVLPMSQVRISRLGARAGVLGAALLARDLLGAS